MQCPDCDETEARPVQGRGSGACSECHGTGRESEETDEPCANCEGSGKCPTCDGEGVVAG